jgi:hypothetical protein
MENPVEEVRSMSLLGTNVMVGIHADGTQEVRTWNANPINPQTASDVDPRLIGGDV